MPTATQVQLSDDAHPTHSVTDNKIKPKLYILGCKIENLKPFNMCATGSSHTHLLKFSSMHECSLKDVY